MTSLHSDIMCLLLPYFDAMSLAKLSQVSKAWKQIVYRPSIWQPLVWKVKEKYKKDFYSQLDIPSNARHIGEPTQLCFHSWYESRLFNIRCDFPREFNTIQEPAKRYSYAQKIWRMKRKPCVHIDHHIWTDVFRGRLFLNDMTDSEIERIRFRVMENPRTDTNAYRVWIDSQLESFHRSVPNYEMNPRLLESQSDDPLERLRVKTYEQHLTSLRHLHTVRKSIIEPYNLSRQVLAKIGVVEFNNNENLYKKNMKPLLDAVAFEIPSAT